jgi:hypothetical protein
VLSNKIENMLRYVVSTAEYEVRFLTIPPQYGESRKYVGGGASSSSFGIPVGRHNYLKYQKVL